MKQKNFDNFNLDYFLI